MALRSQHWEMQSDSAQVTADRQLHRRSKRLIRNPSLPATTPLLLLPPRGLTRQLLLLTCQHQATAQPGLRGTMLGLRR